MYICTYIYIHASITHYIVETSSIKWLRSSSNVGIIRNARKSQLVDRFCRKIVSKTVKRSHRISWCGEMPTDLAELKRTWGSSSASSFVSPLRSFLPLVFLSLYPSLRLLFCLSFFLLRRETRTQERREIEHFKSRWRFPWQAPPSLDPHWFLNDSTAAFRCFLDTTLHR